MDELRKKALQQWRERAEPGYNLSELELKKIIEELQIHQIELEIQNEELRDSRYENEIARKKYFNLFDLAPIGYLVVDEKGIILEANLRATEIFNRQKSYILKKPFISILNRESMSKFHEHFDYVRKNHIMEPFEIALSSSKNNVILQTTISRFSDDHYLVILNDITLRKKAEKETLDYARQLEEAVEIYKQRDFEISELLFATQAVLSSADFQETAKIIFNACKRVIGAKAGYVALMTDDGTENEVLLLDDGGMPCFVDPNLPMPIRGLRAEAYKSGKVVVDNHFMESEWVQFMPPGHMPMNNVMFTPLNVNKKTIGIIGLACKDGNFTENDCRLAQAFGDYAAIAFRNSKNIQQLEQRAKELLESNQTKDKLFSIIGHDLSNPLNNINMLAELLFKGCAEMDEQKIHKLIAGIISASKAGSELLDNIIQWSKVHRKNKYFKPESFDISDLILSATELVCVMAEKKDIIVVNKVMNSFTVFADKNMIAGVLRNLLSNAIKFTNNKGKVVIDCESDDKKVTISVADNGIGMNKKTKDNIFFLDETHTSIGTAGEKGTGLGLLICKDFIEANRGKIWVESTEGKGTTFFFSLPGNG